MGELRDWSRGARRERGLEERAKVMFKVMFKAMQWQLGKLNDLGLQPVEAQRCFGHAAMLWKQGVVKNEACGGV